MAKRSNGVGHNRGVLRIYRSYNFVDGKDPAIDKLRTIVQDEGVTEQQLHVLSGVGQQTFGSWFRGKTRRPQHATLAAAAAALGYDWTLQKIKKVDVATELPKAQRWLDRREEERKASRG